MSKKKLIYCVDIGTSKIVALLGSIGEKIEILGMSVQHLTNKATSGESLVVNGVVLNLEEVTNKVIQALTEARVQADCSYGAVIINITGNNICSYYNSASLELNGKAITKETIRELIDKARSITPITGYETIDFEVQEYLIDNKYYAVNPFELIVQNVESNVNLLLCNQNQLNNLKKIIKTSKFPLTKIVPSGVLSSLPVLNKEEKELGCCMLDIGAGTTDIIVYENGFIRFLYTIPIGGDTFTADIAKTLNLSHSLAEDIKLNYGDATFNELVKAMKSNTEKITILDHRGMSAYISKKKLIEIIRHRLVDLFSQVIDVLKRQGVYDLINSGIVLTGGGSLIPNLESFVKQVFSLPVRLALPKIDGNYSDILSSPKYSTSIGALYYAKYYIIESHNQSDSSTSIGSLIKKIFS